MRFGKTWQEKEMIKQKKLLKMKNTETFFAWRPVKLNDHNWAWLETVKVDYNILESHGKLIACTIGPVYYPLGDKK